MRFLPLTLLAVSLSTPAMTETKEPLRHLLRFDDAPSHYVSVEVRVPTGGRPTVELFMAVWAPGSYLVREFSRHVEDVRATGPGGTVLAVDKTRKNRWRIETKGQPAVTVTYRAYSRDLGVRSNYVERDFGFLNGAPTFLSLVGEGDRPHEVRFVRPPQWARVVTALDPIAGETDAFRAPDFDTLVDSPVILGNPAVYPFDVDGVPHLLANEGEGGVWDGPTSAADTEKIVRAAKAFWGGAFPYPRYFFLNVIAEAGGGLEHKASTLLLASRYRTRTRKSYLGWLSLVAHEHFHAWNVKRLRPVALGPFDYETENYTKDLWVAEGLTDYYADVLLRRAGIATDKEYLRMFSESLEKVETTPGRKVRSLEEASFDAWIKHYRADENTDNTAVDYYAKGAVVGFLLDAELRRRTEGRKSLDDVMRLAYARHAGERGFTSAEFQKVAEEASGLALREFFDAYVRGTKELDYAPALEYYGLRFKPEKKEEDDDKPKKSWLGLKVRHEGGRVVVAQVKRDTPGFAAGFNAEDEILAVGGFRVRSDQWDTRLESLKPGESAEILVSRRDRLVTLRATFEKEPLVRKLEVLPDATDAQKARLAAWLGGA